MAVRNTKLHIVPSLVFVMNPNVSVLPKTDIIWPTFCLVSELFSFFPVCYSSVKYLPISRRSKCSPECLMSDDYSNILRCARLLKIVYINSG